MTDAHVTDYLSRGLFQTSKVGDMTLLSDSMAYRGLDRVLPIFPDEQPLICRFIDVNGSDTVVDAGTGCGVLALYAASCGGKVTGIDILPRAISIAEENARRNSVEVSWKCENYSIDSVKAESTTLVIFNPPHHPAPPGVKVAVHADGGLDGTSVFMQFLNAAAHHIVRGGRIVFFQLTPARGGLPKIFEHLEEQFPRGCGVRFARVLPTVSNEWFLKSVYQDAHEEWIKDSCSAYPELDLLLGEIVEGGPSSIEEIHFKYDITRSWTDRANLHRTILNSV